MQATVIFLAFEVPLAFIAYRASRRIRPLLIPAALFLLAVIVPDTAWSWLLFVGSLGASFALTIWEWVRKTPRDDERQLAVSGPSPWLGQRRGDSLLQIFTGGLVMLLSMVWDASHPRQHGWAALCFACGSLMLGMGLFRRHTVLALYLGRSRARWLEVVQVTMAIAAYGLVTAAELTADADQRLALRLLSLVPFALHFLVVWLPLARAQEQPLLPEEPFA